MEYRARQASQEDLPWNSWHFIHSGPYSVSIATTSRANPHWLNLYFVRGIVCTSLFTGLVFPVKFCTISAPHSLPRPPGLPPGVSCVLQERVMSDLSQQLLLSQDSTDGA